MDSTVNPYAQAPVELAPASPSLRAGLRRLLAALRYGRGDAATSRTRLLSLDARRVLTLTALAAAGAVLASLSALWWGHQSALQRQAEQALAMVDDRLDEIDHELRRLAEHPATEALRQPCPTEMTAALAQASLSSALVQRFYVSNSQGDLVCGPQGPGVPWISKPHSALSKQQGLTLRSSGGIDLRLMAQRGLADGGLVVAMLDSRAFDPRPEQAAWPSRGDAVSLRLHSGSGQRLALLGAAAGPASSAAAMQTILVSSRHDVVVAAELGHDALAQQAWQAALAAAAVAVLLVAFLTDAVWQRTLRRARLRHRIEKGLRRRQFEPHVQPIVDLANGRCVGAEVLMRWNHPERGVLSPAEFIDEAERTGLIVAMSELVMGRAAHQLSPLAQLNPELYFSFNVTPTQLRQPGFGTLLAGLFGADTVRREQVLLELTEREFVDPVAGRALAQLRASGWRTAIDDFGTGQSSLAWLEQLRVDRIKIDRAFVGTIDEQTVKRPVLDAIISLARQLDVGLIAEGVETRSQWDYLASRGVQYAQGYLIARPMSIAAFGQWLAQKQLDAAALPDQASPASSGGLPGTVIDAPSHQLWERLRTNGGLDIRDRLHHLRTYRQCFVGREAVDWLVRHQRASREEAVRIGRRLMALGLVCHVMAEHDFEDDELFYRLAAPRSNQDGAIPAAEDLLHAIRGLQGAKTQDCSRGLIRHRRCATGRALVGWISRSYSVPRATAVQWAAQLMRQGALRHVFDDQAFRDDHTLYRVT